MTLKELLGALQHCVPIGVPGDAQPGGCGIEVGAEGPDVKVEHVEYPVDAAERRLQTDEVQVGRGGLAEDAHALAAKAKSLGNNHKARPMPMIGSTQLQPVTSSTTAATMTPTEPIVSASTSR